MQRAGFKRLPNIVTVIDPTRHRGIDPTLSVLNSPMDSRRFHPEPRSQMAISD
jgi:hypothetical protein